MCELLGMSANVPTDICFSFAGLMQRGGKTGNHSDGWGIAFYEKRGLREFKDPFPSYRSEIARLVRNYPIKSHVVISHIRKANAGKVCLENTHPFTRELWGQYWTFAHNGQLKGIKKRTLRHYFPVGSTDSEHAFCWIMDQLREKFPNKPRHYGSVYQQLHQLSEELRSQGVFNMLMSDSRHLFSYCSTKLSWITRKAPFEKATLKDDEFTIDFEKETTPDDIVTVIATEPLTDNEQWHKLAAGDMVVFTKGTLTKTLRPR
ncbi:class II glutamine amidotransferase [Candidatus Sororendozoicomonas aggregata]|uniref:class II glutamine amidotransferase n=1 Tax=Candidatus Sororendozoicomonas aggregata TaxID=3073239 RepID=UPI002ED35A05